MITPDAVAKADVAKVGEEIEVFEEGGKFSFKLKGSDPPVSRRFVIDRNFDIQFDSGRKFSLIGGRPGLMLEIVEEPRSEFQVKYDLPAESHGEERRFRDYIIPGVCFKILS